MANIFCVEDDTGIRELITCALQSGGYTAKGFPDGKSFFQRVQEEQPALILLDIMLPDEDGISILKRLKSDAATAEIPVIMLSAKSSEIDKVTGLENGADDYITKPFTLALVKMHIEAVLKRAGKLRTMVEYNDLQADVNAQLLFYKEQHIPTTRKEFDLMVYFMEHPGIVLPRDTILNAVWEYDYTGDVRTIDTLVKQLRKKMGEGCNYIRTVYGVGYIFGEDIHEN